VIDGIQNVFKIPELKKRILYTFALLAVYRIGAFVPTPGIDSQAMARYFENVQGTILGFFNMFSGGALEQMAVFALGIMPYISASIILELLTVVVPYLEKLKKEGEPGRKKNQSVYPLWRGCVEPDPRPGYCYRPGAYGSWRGADRPNSRLVVSSHDHVDIDGWYHIYHVARGTNHRARHR